MLDIIIADLTNTRLWVVVLIWAAIGVFNKVVYYEAGERSGNAARNKIHRYTPERAVKFHSLYDRWGSLLLMLASVPVIGQELASRHLIRWDFKIVAVTDGGGR